MAEEVNGNAQGAREGQGQSGGARSQGGQRSRTNSLDKKPRTGSGKGFNGKRDGDGKRSGDRDRKGGFGRSGRGSRNDRDRDRDGRDGDRRRSRRDGDGERKGFGRGGRDDRDRARNSNNRDDRNRSRNNDNRNHASRDGERKGFGRGGRDDQSRDRARDGERSGDRGRKGGFSRRNDRGDRTGNRSDGRAGRKDGFSRKRDDRFPRKDGAFIAQEAPGAQATITDGAAEGASESGAPARTSWTPNRERTVRSKKDFDQKKMEHLMGEDQPVYRGELDPRQKDPERKPRSIPFSEQRVMDKAARLAEQEQAADGRARLVTHSDFRDQFERCEASPGRLAALYATHQVRRRNAYAQEIIEASIDTARISAEDRAFATLLTLGVVSTSGALDAVINRCIASPRDIKNDVRDALRISAYEIIFLKKAPHAALDQGVELVRAMAPSASGLANAVLHRILESSEQFPFGDPTVDIEALALMYAFPAWLAKQLIADMGAQAAVALMQASNEPAPLFIFVNALQATDEEVVSLFAEVGVDIEPAGSGGLGLPGCYRVPNARSLADGRIQRLFNQGKILVSDASAQAVANCVLEDGLPASMLEVGSGRGTKSVMLQSLAHRKFGEQMQLTCMDNHGFKTDLLRERAQAYGIDIADFVTGNATRLDSVMGERSFDAIFVDSPCSGLGTLRRHHEIRWRLQPEQIDDLAEVSLALLKSAAGHVAPGGRLVYSTCTVTYAENNGVVKRFLESEEGSAFALAPIAGKACFASQLSSGSPDAHFAAKFVRK